MTEPDRIGIASRLWSLPGQLLLALINATSIMVIVAALGNSLREIKAREHPALQSKIAQLKEALTVLNISVERLGSARSVLTDEAIGQLGRTVTDALTKLRDCSPALAKWRPTAPLETRRSKPGGPPALWKPAMKIDLPPLWVNFVILTMRR